MGDTPSQKDSEQKPLPKRARRHEDDDDDKPQSGSSVPWMLAFVVLAILMLWLWKDSPGNTGTRVPFSFFWQQLEADNVSEVKFYGETLTGKWRKVPTEKPTEKSPELKDSFNTYVPKTVIEGSELFEQLTKYKVQMDGERTDPGLGTTLLIWMIGPLLLIGFFWFMMRRNADPMQSGMMGNFIRSPAKRFHASEQRTTYEDVAGMEQAKLELEEVVEFLKTPEKFLKLGATIPKGILLMGPPGTGKTLLARATAGEAGVPFYSISGSEFIQMFVGVGASRVRDLFKTAKETAPCILFIDEIDAVGRHRGAGLGGGHDEREQTLNQILTEMDGFLQHEAVIVLAATNRPDILDPALLRPGRFDRHVTIDRPTKEGREAILKVHCRKVPLSDDVDLAAVAASTIGFSGADLKNLVNESALNAARGDNSSVKYIDFETARDRVLMGAQREEILNEQEKELTAYHEAGHALLAWLLPGVDPVHKVSIIPRGRSLGVTQLLPDEERFHIGEKRLHAQLVMILGGRAAEKCVFDEYSAGAEDDLKKASQLARRMVAYWGMSDAVGPVAFRHSEEHPFLGKEIHENKDFSEETAHVIDQEVQRFLIDAAKKAFTILSEKRSELDQLAKALLENESISKSDMEEILGAKIVAATKHE